MRQGSRTILRFTLIFLLACLPAVAQRRGGGTRAYAARGAAPIYGGGGAYGGYGFYPSTSQPLPNFGLIDPYVGGNPCQAGCNPNAGYEWDSVGTLILDTNPPQARVTLDGIYAGTTDRLGPFQLPVGQHTLHIEAAGFEPSDVIVKFDEPGVQSLNVQLKALPPPPKPAPRR